MTLSCGQVAARGNAGGWKPWHPRGRGAAVMSAMSCGAIYPRVQWMVFLLVLRVWEDSGCSIGLDQIRDFRCEFALAPDDVCQATVRGGVEPSDPKRLRPRGIRFLGC